jgi:hypothetical protein
MRKAYSDKSSLHQYLLCELSNTDSVSALHHTTYKLDYSLMYSVYDYSGQFWYILQYK